ncbi:MAG: hypothetical protein H0W81_09155 [Chloroflexi bacterium]|nr:hypothetical protein [Chloroflexota bacterium]
MTGRHPAVGLELAPLVDVASAVRAALGPLPAGARFEARLAARLASHGSLEHLVAAIGGATRRELRHPGRILLTGAVSSAAVGVGVTVLAMRRVARRHATAGQQPAHR